jgi:hypothetical protein
MTKPQRKGRQITKNFTEYKTTYAEKSNENSVSIVQYFQTAFSSAHVQLCSG